MAKQPRKQPQGKPITQNQLFPAVVALWFGALFGLGSLAVRPSLLESLVIKSRIDLVLPAAAPPLGITARILVALALAAIGSAIGIAIARRVARPKVVVRERKRSKLATVEAPAARPYGSAAAQTAEGQILAPRRRSLSIEHDEDVFVPHDNAPLPGGTPQVLDISSVGFRAESVEAPLDLSGYPAPPPVEPAQPPAFAPLPVAEVHVNHSATEAAAAAADGRQVFGMPPVTLEAEAPKQIFGQPVENGHVSPEFVKAAGFQTTVFEGEEPSPLFPPREQVATPAPAVPAAPFAMPQPFAVPAAEMPASSFDMAPQQAMPQAFEPAPEPAPVSVVPSPAPAATEPLPSPAGLGMDDLSSRLAASMARRRAVRTGTAAEAVVPLADAAVPGAPAFAAPLPETEFVPQAPAAPVPQAYTPELEPTPEAGPAQIAPIAAPAPAPAEQAPAPAIPAAMRPLELGQFEDDAEPFYHLLPPRHIAMPQPVPAEVAPPPVAFDAPTDCAEEPAVAEDNYASLLGIAPAPARSGFVRIEEPEAGSAAIEPVVIFPGQMAQAVAPASASASALASFRPFDAPASAGHGQPVSASLSAPAVDHEEADRALRMALANLQRMSGAA